MRKRIKKITPLLGVIFLFLYVIWSRNLEQSAKAMSVPIYSAVLSSGVELTTEGVASHTLYPGSDENAIETLTITFTENLDKPSQMTVSVPPGMSFWGEVLYSDSFIERGTMPTSTYTTYDKDIDLEGIQQGTGSYVNEEAGTFVISLPALVKGDEIHVNINYDRQIWSHMGNEPVTNSTAISTVHIEGVNTHTKSIEDIYVSASHLASGFFLYFPPKSEGGTETVGLDNEGTFPVALLPPYRGVNNMELHVKEATYTIDRPYHGTGADRVYADYVAGSCGELENEKISVEETSTQVIIKIQDYVHVVGSRFPVSFYFSSSKFAVGQELAINGSISLSPYIGEQNLPTQGSTGTKSLRIASEDVNLILYSASASFNTKSYQEGDGMELLGIMGFENTGGDDATQTEVHYQFDIGTSEGNRNKLDVVAVNLPFPTVNDGEVPDIYIEFVDEYGENGFTRVVNDRTNTRNETKVASYIVIDHTISQNKEYAVTEGEFIEGKTYYIKSVRYTIPLIKAVSVCGSYDSGAIGGIYGYAIAPLGSEGNTVAQSKLTMRPSNAQFLLDQERNFTIQASPSTWEIPILLSGITTDKQTIDEIESISNVVPGEKIRVKAELGMHDYPYTNSTNVPNPLVFIIEPDGFKINSVEVYRQMKENVEPLGYTKTFIKTLTNGDKAYQLELDEGYSLYDLNYLYDIPTSTTRLIPSNRPVIEVEFLPDIKLENTFINLDELIFVADKNITQDGTGAYDGYEVFDEHDLHPTKNYIAKSKDTDIVNINVNKNDLAVVTSIDSSWQTEKKVSNEGIETKENYFQYVLQVDNQTAGSIRIENNEFYVPIPEGVTLVAEPSIKGSGHLMDLQYSNIATVETIHTVEDWSDEVEDYEAVTMIKMTGNKNYSIIPSLARIGLEVPLIYDGVVGIEEAGESISLYSYQLQKMSEDDSFEGSEPNPTNAVFLEKCYVIREETEVVAEIDRPELGNTSISLDALTENIDLYVTGVQPHNINLQNPADVVGNASSVEIADTNYGVSIKLGGEVKALENTLDEAYYLGRTSETESNQLEIILDYYQNFFDQDTQRYVDITLSNYQGIEIYVRVNLVRRATIDGIPTNGIIGGTYYTQINTNSSLALTQDSNFTAQYIMTQPSWSNTYEWVVIKLIGTTFPIGTKITVIHTARSDTFETLSDEPTRLYYEVEEQVSSIRLSQFKEMKSGAVYNQSLPVPANTQKHVLQIVVDFRDVADEDLIAVGDYELECNGGGTDGKVNIPFSVVAKRVTTITSQVIESTSNVFTVESQIETDEIEAYDAKNLNHYAAIKVMFFNKEGEMLAPPKGGFVVINGVKYPAAGELYFINTVGQLRDMTITYSLEFPMEELDEGLGELAVKTELYTSLTRENGLTQYVDQSVDTFVLTPTSNLAVDLRIDTPIITKNGGIQVPVTLDLNEEAAKTTMVLQLYQKTVTGVYEVVETGVITYLQNAPMNYVLLGNGKIIKYTNDYNRTETVQNRFILHLDESIVEDEAKTYRLILTSQSAYNDFEEIENFIVLPNEEL